MKRLSALVAVAAGAALIAVLAVVYAPQAYASDHKVPKTVLKLGKEELQTGRKVWEYSWNYPAGGGTCVAEQAVLDFGFRPADSVPVGSKLKVRIGKRHKPDSFHMVEVNENGEEQGQVDVLLKRVIKNNRTVAWNAIFHVGAPEDDPREYYLVAEGHWKDRQGCNADQYAYWTFHVETQQTL